LTPATGPRNLAGPIAQEAELVGFNIGDKLVYPNHGVGVVETIGESLFDGRAHPCYQVRLLANNSRVVVPVGNSERVGLRPLTRRQDVNVVFKVLEDGTFQSNGDWKGRFKQNLDKMRSGRLSDIADVLKNLNWVQKQKTLSFREKKMYERARYLIVSEIAQVSGNPEAEVELDVEKALDRSVARRRSLGPSPR
jgi:CarD family transcriptional regulator